MQRSAFESFHPWVIFGYLAAVLAVTMSTMHPVMIVTSFVISLVYSLFLCGRVVWKRSVMTGLGVAVFTMGILPLFRHNGATPLFYINDMAVTRENILFGGMMTLLLLAVLQWFYVWNETLWGREDHVSDRASFAAVSLVITMTLRYLPLLERRMDQIRAGRSAGMGSGSSVLRRLSVLLYVVVRGFDRDHRQSAWKREAMGSAGDLRFICFTFGSGMQSCSWFLQGLRLLLSASFFVRKHPASIIR